MKITHVLQTKLNQRVKFENAQHHRRLREEARVKSMTDRISNDGSAKYVCKRELKS